VAFCRKKRKWNGPPQYENPTGELMMLETDLVSCWQVFDVSIVAAE